MKFQNAGYMKFQNSVFMIQKFLVAVMITSFRYKSNCPRQIVGKKVNIAILTLWQNKTEFVLLNQPNAHPTYKILQHFITPTSFGNAVPSSGSWVVKSPCLLSSNYFEIAYSVHFNQIIFFHPSKQMHLQHAQEGTVELRHVWVIKHCTIVYVVCASDWFSKIK
jgi:hypothetical protein